MNPFPSIRLHRVSKRFGGVAALRDVSFEIGRGEIHAVVGENGAGKSTLMKLLAGIHEPDSGEVQLAGHPVRLRNPREAQRQGIGIVFQELNLFPHRTATANIFANRELSGPLGLVREGRMREIARGVLSDLGAGFSPNAVVGSLAAGERQLVEIARALEQQPRILILDEPNSALNEAESTRLFEILRRLRARGLTLIYVSHRLEEVFAIADRITVLRDGQCQGTWRTAETTIPKIIAAMIGRSLEESFPRRSVSLASGAASNSHFGLRRPPEPAEAGTPNILDGSLRGLEFRLQAVGSHNENCWGAAALEVRSLEAFRLGPVSFSAKTGEIVGFAGLEGSGVDTLFQALFRLIPITGGQIFVRGQLQKGTSPPRAIREGWALIPRSRREEGLLMDWSIARNATLLTLEKLLTRWRLIDGAAVRNATAHFIERLGIGAERLEEKVVNLSGGNQQKVLFAKWLATEPGILILNDPTRGVDVGAKREIHQICQDLASQGMTLLMASSEVEELVGLADRTFVLRQGKLFREFHRDQTTKAGLLHALSGAGTGAAPDEINPPSSAP